MALVHDTWWRVRYVSLKCEDQHRCSFTTAPAPLQPRAVPVMSTAGPPGRLQRWPVSTVYLLPPQRVSYNLCDVTECQCLGKGAHSGLMSYYGLAWAQHPIPLSYCHGHFRRSHHVYLLLFGKENKFEKCILEFLQKAYNSFFKEKLLSCSFRCEWDKGSE